MITKPSVRLVVIADCHLGAKGGYPHESLFLPENTEDGRRQRCIKKAIDNLIDKYSKPDILLANGDLIEGKGPKTGGTELLTTDRALQCTLMAEELLRWQAKSILITHGTSYHTGKEEDWESVIAQYVGAHIATPLVFDIYNERFNARHHVNPSSVPNGRFTSLAKEAMWEEYNAVMMMRDHIIYRAANHLLRAHVHQHYMCGDNSYTAYTSPALCSSYSKFGLRRCSGYVDFGLLVFDVTPDGVRMTKEISRLEVDNINSKAINFTPDF